MSKFSFNGQTGADLVVYGKVFTAEGNQLAEAFAVKDGRYVYVGDRKGAEAFIEAGRTELVDHTGKGLVMASYGDTFGRNFKDQLMANAKLVADIVRTKLSQQSAGAVPEGVRNVDDRADAEPAVIKAKALESAKGVKKLGKKLKKKSGKKSEKKSEKTAKEEPEKEAPDKEDKGQAQP